MTSNAQDTIHQFGHANAWRGTLTRAIKEAINNGWLPYFASFDENMTKENIIVEYIEGSNSLSFDYVMKGHIRGISEYSMEPYSIIYSHDFAKAFWRGTEDDYDDYEFKYHTSGLGGAFGVDYTGEPWQFHLQEMIIAEDPIKYLAGNFPIN